MFGEILFQRQGKTIFIQYCFGLLLLGVGIDAFSAQKEYSFAPTNQTTITSTAREWNPILEWVSKRAGIKISLRLGKDAVATTTLLEREQVDFALNNHFFSRARDSGQWRVIARIDEPPIRGVVLTKTASSVHTLSDLQGMTVGFPSKEAFVGFQVIAREMKRRGIAITPIFGGNQAAALSLLENDVVAAAGLASNLASHMLKGRAADYRVLWSSEEYLPLPIIVSSRVPRQDVAKIKNAFIAMQKDVDGKKILDEIRRISSRPLPGFVSADDADYAQYRKFYAAEK